jgi:hypothetical protein
MDPKTDPVEGPPTVVPLRVKTFENGPFRGRIYEVQPGCGLGRRRPDLEQQRDAIIQQLRTVAKGVHNAHDLDRLLAHAPAHVRDELRERLRPFLAFEGENRAEGR